jgi:hypothetical protein
MFCINPLLWSYMHVRIMIKFGNIASYMDTLHHYVYCLSFTATVRNPPLPPNGHMTRKPSAGNNKPQIVYTPNETQFLNYTIPMGFSYFGVSYDILLYTFRILSL